MANEKNFIQEKAYEALKKMKGLGIAVAIIMILLGTSLFFQPVAASAFMVWFLVAGILINGIEKLVAYAKMPKGGRDGFLLATGIMLILISLILIGRGFHYEYAVTASIEACIAVMIAFTCIFNGFGKICGSNLVKEAGGSKGLAILSGTLDVLCGFILLSAPLFGLFAITVVFGLYLLVTGITLLIRCISL